MPITVMTAKTLADQPLFIDHVDDPVMGGRLGILWCEHGLVRILHEGSAKATPAPAMAFRRFPGLKSCLAGKTAPDHLPIVLAGTSFQLAVWQRIAAIPHGKTISYRALAEAAGHPGAIRAAGTACGRNPLPRVIPCHRVLGSGGRLGGFAFGLAMKRRLLDGESRESFELAA